MNRRGFLGLLATGLVGTCVVAKIPTAWIPEPIRRYAACEFMRRHFNEWCDVHGRAPDELRLGRRLYEAYEAEVMTMGRIFLFGGVSENRGAVYLMFKGVRAYECATNNWGLTIIGYAQDRGAFDAVTFVEFRPVLKAA